MKTLLFSSLFVVVLFCQVSKGALQVTPSVDGNLLVADFLGGGVPVSNVQYIGQPSQCGFFSVGTSSNVGLGFDSGIVLTTGDVNLAVGPNQSEGSSANLGTAGDADLDLLTSNNTFDAAVLEFDFELATNAEVTFDFIFASEEYLEYVNFDFNDGFALLLNGTNIALLPNSNIEVCIDNVNNVSNPQFYVDNPQVSQAFDLEYDGFTVPIQATTGLLPAGTHHLKIVIADAGDSALDSAVFLKSSSFQIVEQCAFESDNVLCELDEIGQPTGSNIVTGLFTNLQDIPGTHLFLPGGATSPVGVELCFGNGTHVLNLDPSLNNGDSVEVGADTSNTDAIIIKNAMPGEEVCFRLVLLGDNGVECCSIEVCFEMPPCDCLQIDRRFDEITEIVCNVDGTVDFSYSFQLTNLFGQDVFHSFLAPNGFESFSFDYFDLVVENSNAPLGQGQSVNLKTVIRGALPGMPVDFLIAIHVEDLSECCSRDHDVTAPLCDGTGKLHDDSLPGDVNEDGVVDLQDVQPFVHLLTSGDFNINADVNNDGVLNLADVAPFVALLTDTAG